jgi:hypothetical protein
VPCGHRAGPRGQYLDSKRAWRNYTDETKLSRDETKLSFKTTEFYAMAGVIEAILAAGGIFGFV